MAIPVEHVHRYAYHFTSIENLPEILEHGLLSYNEKRKRNVNHVSVAEDSIQKRRSRMPVTCGPGGVVHDYVPFYFCKRTSMLQAVILRKNVDQQFLIYIAVSIDWVDKARGIFTDASANTEPAPTFYSDSNDLCRLKWDLIDSMSWTWSSDQKQARMAELLIHGKVPVSAFKEIITWNTSITGIVRDEFRKCNLQPPTISEDGHFYYTRYPHESTRSLVTGPYFLKRDCKEVVSEALKAQRKKTTDNSKFNSIEDAISCIEDDFCILNELAEIDDLQTANPEHYEGVGEHTRRVAATLKGAEAFQKLNGREQAVVLFSAYLHDIGKGVSPRDGKGRQKADADHPVNALTMVKRILSEEFGVLKKKDVRQIVLLVAYHDLIGDIVGKGRDRQQLLDVIECAEDFDMLAALNCADVESLIPEGGLARMISSHPGWLERIKAGLPGLREWALENLEDEE